MLEIKGMSKKFGEKVVYDNIDLSFDKGIYVLLAPNGAGKTTLMDMIVTLTKPTSGEILYEGENIYSLADMYRGKIGYLPQRTGYYKNYTAVENLIYIAALKGLDKKTAVSLIDEYMAKFGLADVKNKKLKEYSGGMLQRVGIIGALLNNPEILVLDEPTAGLDPKERVRLKNILSDLGKDRTIIVSTHITSDIEFIANKIIMIKGRKILHCDSVENICSTYKGKIYETLLKSSQIMEFENNHYVLIEQYEGEAVKVRFHSEEKPDSKWQIVTPNLEDVFMCEYRDSRVDKEGE